MPMTAEQIQTQNLAEDGDRLAIHLGTPLQVEFQGVHGRAKSRLVGMESGKYVIVTLPSSELAIGNSLFRGNMVTVRYLHEGRAYGFRSPVLGSIANPVPLLFLGSPEVIAERNLRAERRASCHLPCRLGTGESFHAAAVADLSLLGCRCRIPLSGGPDRSAIAAGSELQLMLQVPGRQGELQLPVSVRNVESESDALHLGLQFGDVPADASQALRDYLAQLP